MHKLKNNFNVTEYEFDHLGGILSSGANVEKYQLQEISGEILHKEKPAPLVIRKEREAAREKSFKIEEIIETHRGLKKQADEDYEKRIHEEVELKLKSAHADAVKKGYDDGYKKGEEKAYSESMQLLEKQVDLLKRIVNEVEENKKEVFHQNKQDCYELVRALTKWVLLKEINDDGYLKDLLEKLILEIGTRKNLLLRVNKQSFSKMPEVVKVVENKLGELTNLRVEVHHEMDKPGIMIETENSILDGSLKAQFQAIDSVFKGVGLVAEELNESELSPKDNGEDPHEE